MSHTSIRCRSSPNPEQTSCEKQFTKQRGVTVSLLPPAAATATAIATTTAAPSVPAAHGQTQAQRPAGPGWVGGSEPVRESCRPGMTPGAASTTALAITWDTEALSSGHSVTQSEWLSLSESQFPCLYYRDKTTIRPVLQW